MAELKDTLKRIDFQTGEFTANGTLYRIEGALTIERYAELQILEKELGYGMNFKTMYERLEKLYKLINATKFADAAVLLNDVMRGIAKVQEREPTVLKICALFINADNEDRTAFSQPLIDKKISDWKAEGIDMRDFFMVASNSVSGYLEVYRKVTQLISGQESGPIPGAVPNQ
jgi:hypothetical protein